MPDADPCRGHFITLEGVDGAGKSSHVGWLVDALQAAGHTVVATREPGGTPIGEALRALALHQAMRPDTETLLMFAARCEHLHTVIEPALARGAWVVCDRFTDASYAYQGGGRNLGTEVISELDRWLGWPQPDCTLLFDVPLAVARERRGQARAADRFEQEADAYFERVRNVYLARANAFTRRIRLVDATQPLAGVRRQLEPIVAELLRRP